MNDKINDINTLLVPRAPNLPARQKRMEPVTMTNPTPPGQVPEALLLADQYAAAHAKWELEDLYGSSKSYTAEKLAERHAARAKLERALCTQQDDAYDHGPQAETVEEAARDVGKWLNERPNRPLDLRHVAMLTHHAKRTQQPAPATQKLKGQICINDINQSAACAVGSVGTTSDAQTTHSTHDAPATQQAAEREQERTAFKDAHRHLELYEVPDAWGRPMFKHSHVEASWLGWIARASHGQAPADGA